jgi:hypothetical protein
MFPDREQVEIWEKTVASILFAEKAELFETPAWRIHDITAKKRSTSISDVQNVKI